MPLLLWIKSLSKYNEWDNDGVFVPNWNITNNFKKYTVFMLNGIMQRKDILSQAESMELQGLLSELIRYIDENPLSLPQFRYILR